MSIFKKTVEDASKEAGTVIGNIMSSNVQNGTDAAIEGMSFFRQKAFDTRNAGFDQSKGNLFEYIEAAKFNRSAANAGKSARAIVTDITDPHAEADILIKDNGKIAKEIQAKFIKTSKDGRDISAATSVRDQTGANNKGWGQYDGMDRLIRKQDNYNSEGSILDEAKKLSKARADSNGIYSEYYRDVNEHLTDETQYDGVSSGGTTYEEVQAAHDNPELYAKQFENKQVAVEMKATAKNMAKASFVTTGIISGISNMVSVFRDEKSLAEALKDVGADSVKGAARGAATGAISTAIRYKGIKAGSKLLSDSTAATVMAGGLVDGGVALFQYAKGEIDAEGLRDQLVDTTAKATTTIFYTKAVEAIMGASVSPFVPMMVYTTASYVITATREIIKNAKLNIEECNRMTAILEEATIAADEYKKQMHSEIARIAANQRALLIGFIDNFEYNIETGENYDQALLSIVSFAEQAGMQLQHVDFFEFKKAMTDKETVFVLGDNF